MAERRLKFWGWGYEDEGPDIEAARRIAQALAARFGGRELEVDPYPRIEDVELRSPRVAPPAALSAILSDDRSERARHSYGASYRDVVRGFRRQFSQPPDWVAFPRDEPELIQVLDWCESSDLAAIPFGGGSSVVGGVESAVDDRYSAYWMTCTGLTSRRCYCFSSLLGSWATVDYC